MAKETLSQRHKRYREIFGMNEELKNPYLDFGELVAAIRSSFIAERFDESSLVIHVMKKDGVPTVQNR